MTQHQHGLSVCSKMCLQQIAVSEASSLSYSYIFLLMKDFILLATCFKHYCKLSTWKNTPYCIRSLRNILIQLEVKKNPNQQTCRCAFIVFQHASHIDFFNCLFAWATFTQFWKHNLLLFCRLHGILQLVCLQPPVQSVPSLLTEINCMEPLLFLCFLHYSNIIIETLQNLACY